MKNRFKIQVRDNGSYHEAFFWEEKELTSFSFVDGHGIATNAYRLQKTFSVSREEAEGFRNAMQRYYDSLPGAKIELVLVDKLKTTTRGNYNG